jgi:hypothetical protein
LERHPSAREFLKRRAEGDDRLLKPRRFSLPRPERLKRNAKVVLGFRPLERHPIARAFLKRRTEGDDRLLEPRRTSLPHSEGR